MEIKEMQVIGMSRTGTAINFVKNLRKQVCLQKRFCSGILQYSKCKSCKRFVFLAETRIYATTMFVNWIIPRNIYTATTFLLKVILSSFIFYFVQALFSPASYVMKL